MGSGRKYAVRYGFAVLCTLVFLVVGLFLFPFFQSTSATFFMVAVILTVRFAGTGPAVLTLLLSILATDYFLTVPRFRFGATPNDVAWFAVFAILSLTIILLAESLKRAAGTARQREASYQATLSSIGDAVITTDPKGRVTFMNPVAEALTGRRLDEARLQPLENVFTLLDEKTRQPAPMAPAGTLESDKAPADNGSLLVSREGVERPVEKSASPLRDDDGRVQGAVFIFRDVSSRRHAEVALQESSRFARVTLDALAANVCVLDEQGAIVAVNKSWRHFARAYGLVLPDNGVAANYLAVCDASAFEGCEEAAAFAKAIRAVLGGERESYFHEYRLSLGGRESWFIARVTRFPGKGARRAVVTHEDITPLKQAQQQLRALNETLEQRVAQRTSEVVRAQEALRQAERLAVVGQMTAVLGHESRNALQRIQTCMDMLERRVRDNPEALKFIQETRNAQRDLQRVHEEVRSYAAPLVLDLGTHDLASIWRQAWQSLDALRKGRMAALLESSVAPDTTCSVDPFRMEQVFRNLMENALAACSDPVQVFVHCSEDRLDGREALRVSVRDNGPGLNPEQLERIFEPFYTTKSRGTGLGMAIVRRIVEGHGGRVWVEPPVPGRGLEVVFLLDRPALTEEPSEPQSEPVSE